MQHAKRLSFICGLDHLSILKNVGEDLNTKYVISVNPIRALVSARGSEKNGKKQKLSPRLKSRLPVPLYVFMTKTENRNFQGLIKQFPPNRFIQKSSQEFLFWLQTTCQNFKLNRYIDQEIHRLEIWQN